MAIDLQVPIRVDITVGELRLGVAQTILELTGNQVPHLSVTSLNHGVKSPVTDKTMIVGDGLIILEVADLDVQVLLNVFPFYEEEDNLFCAVTAEYARDAVELTLAACCTIWLARQNNAMIQDTSEFWTDASTISPDELVRQLAVRDVEGLETACKRIVGTRIFDD